MPWLKLVAFVIIFIIAIALIISMLSDQNSLNKAIYGACALGILIVIAFLIFNPKNAKLLAGVNASIPFSQSKSKESNKKK